MAPDAQESRRRQSLPRPSGFVEEFLSVTDLLVWCTIVAGCLGLWAIGLVAWLT
jgi:hypothetical protein